MERDFLVSITPLDTQDTFGGNNTITEAEGIQAVKILGKLKMKSTLIWSQP